MAESSNSNAGLRALAFAAVGGWLVYDMATATEMPSRAVAVMQYVFLIGIVIGLGQAIYQLMADK